MKCINCGSEAAFIYQSNSLCWHCFELKRLLEMPITSSFSKSLLNKIDKDKKKCRWWIKSNRLRNKYDYPKIIK